VSASTYTVGNVTVDDLVFPDGRTRMGVPGGNSVYAALGARVWGEPVGIVSVCGPDYPLGALAALGVELEHLHPSRPRTLRNWGLYEEDGSRQFVFRGRAVRWEDFSPLPPDLPDRRGLHVHLAPLPVAHQLALTEALRGPLAARTLTLDPDDRALGAVPREDLRALLERVDAFLPSRQEAAALFPALGPEDALLALRELSPATPVIAVKLGRDGVILSDRGQAGFLRVPAHHEDALDPTGAGDAFCGGFLYGYATTRDPLRAALHGSVAASFAVEGVGIDGLRSATVTEARRRLAALEPRVERLEPQRT
jgi:sugar/nucleoside kinase (ribokinase family)